jgi:hypothetical protein
MSMESGTERLRRAAPMVKISVDISDKVAPEQCPVSRVFFCEAFDIPVDCQRNFALEILPQTNDFGISEFISRVVEIPSAS